MLKPEYNLTSWELEQGSISMGNWYRLTGYTLGDPRWADGTKIYTSMLMSIDFEKNIAETKNSIYNLIG